MRRKNVILGWEWCMSYAGVKYQQSHTLYFGSSPGQYSLPTSTGGGGMS